MAALLATQQIAGTTDLQVERCDAEAAAEIAELTDRRQALARDRRKRLLRRNQKIRIGRPIRSADAAAELICCDNP